MTLFLDTSALLKRYIDEPGTRDVVRAMEADPDWVASALAETETELALCHLLEEEDLRDQVRTRFRTDWARFLVVAVDRECLLRAAEIGCDQRVRTLDALHLAAASRLPGPVTLLTFDARQAAAAAAMGMLVPAGGR